MRKTQTPAARKATIDDVAALAKVSIKTVSRVFNSEPNVRPTTRERVLAAAKELDYRPNLSARRLAAKRAFVIGLLYDNPQSDYIIAIQEGSLEICRQYGYQLLIHPCSDVGANLVDEVLSLKHQGIVDGFLLSQPISENEVLLGALTEQGIPHVRISQRAIGDASWVEQGTSNFESGYAAARRLLTPSPRPTAIFACNDHMAMGVLVAAHERRLEIPADLSVCGFDDTPMAHYAWPPLTTSRQPIKQVASIATEALLKRIQGGSEGDDHFLLHSELVRRDSTGPCPDGP